ncbi:hypothetical protein [Pedobacter sp. P26]|uniref:hypothetical protein n=1 Tax=Pedobacter sp. P26 TaxID=3423956 RepID=UPI003D67F5B2
MDAFIKNRGTEWGKTLSSIHEMAKVTKNEIVEFAKNFFKNNYVAVYKHKGEEKQIVKVDKPIITAVNTNSNLVSNFTKQIINSSVKPIEPKFLDYKKDLSFGTAGMAEVISIENKENEVFRMGYRFELGSYSNKLLPYAAQYLSFLSTDKYSAEEISMGISAKMASRSAFKLSPHFALK